MSETPKMCPHCESSLRKWLVPDGASWDDEFFYVCFNDECSYYQRGWVWMKSQFNQEGSYRYMVNPATGCSSPLPVWSDSATREMIVEDGNGGGA